MVGIRLISKQNPSNSATVWPGTSGLESLLSEIKLDVSRGRVAVTPSRQQYAYFQMNMLMRIQATLIY